MSLAIETFPFAASLAQGGQGIEDLAHAVTADFALLRRVRRGVKGECDTAKISMEGVKPMLASPTPR